MQRTRTAKKQQQLFVEEVIKHFGVFLCVLCPLLILKPGKKGVLNIFANRQLNLICFPMQFGLFAHQKSKPNSDG